MSTFTEIVAEAASTMHKTYSVDVPAVVRKKRRTDLFRNVKLPAPPKPERPKPTNELRDLRDAERAERAIALAAVVHSFGPTMWEKAEELDVNIGGLIDPPVHVTTADAEMPVTTCLIRE